MSNTPSPTKVRVTVPVAPHVLEAFQRLAEVNSVSTGRAMGDWLADTVEGAEFLTGLLAKARQSPKLAIQELHGMALGLGDETQGLLDKLREKGRLQPAGGPRSSGGAAGGGRTPPSSNTGGKGTKSTTRGPAGKRS